jgi:predicted NAD-dependent protein-ADP-ribosyltransferase YbiA (DUF1768 family)
MLKLKTVHRFHKEFAFLAPRYPINIHWFGIKFPSVEHALVGSMTKDVKLRESIYKASPKELESIKTSIKPFQDWNGPLAMQNLNEIKFGLTAIGDQFYHPMVLYKKLAETGDADLINENMQHDNYWGSCICGGPDCRISKNMLGFILMEIREKLHSRIQLYNQRSKPCLCGKPSKTSILYTLTWYPKVRSFCEDVKCIMRESTEAMEDSSDKMIVGYSNRSNSGPKIYTLPTQTKVESKPVEVKERVTDEDDYGDFNFDGYGGMVPINLLPPTQIKTTSERKYETISWKF